MLKLTKTVMNKLQVWVDRHLMASYLVSNLVVYGILWWLIWL